MESRCMQGNHYFVIIHMKECKVLQRMQAWKMVELIISNVIYYGMNMLKICISYKTCIEIVSCEIT